MHNIALTCGLVASLLLSARAEATPAQKIPTLYIDGKIYSGAGRFVEAMLVADGRIDAVGATAALRRRAIRAKAKLVDLRGRTVIPGIIDSHVHTLFGSMALHGINLSTPERSLGPDRPEAYVAALKTFALAHPADRIVFARSEFDTSNPPNHELLDRAVLDRPLVVHHIAEHALWVNAKALALAGIGDKPYPDPLIEAGISRDQAGRPTGGIAEGSMVVVERAVAAALPLNVKLELLRKGIRFLNSFGITMVVNATGNLAEVELYGALRERKQLAIRTRTAFGDVSVPHSLTRPFLADLDTARRKYHDDWVSANLVKFFMDGGDTAAGQLYSERDFKTLVSELDRRGFHVMTHALRPGSVHTILNVYEQVEKETGKRDHRFRIEHADLVFPEDLPRFGKLAVIASMQPSFCCDVLPASLNLTQDRWRSFLSSGARLAFSSDWPCTFPPNPFVGMQELVTRDQWNGTGYGAAQAGRRRTGAVDHPEQRLTITEAVDGYTSGGAKANAVEDRLGTLQPGRLADFAILDRDIFTVNSSEIGQTLVAATVVGGNVVYGRLP